MQPRKGNFPPPITSQIAKFRGQHGPTWVLSAPGGPHVGPTNLVIRDTYFVKQGHVSSNKSINIWNRHGMIHGWVCYSVNCITYYLKHVNHSYLMYVVTYKTVIWKDCVMFYEKVGDKLYSCCDTHFLNRHCWCLPKRYCVNEAYISSWLDFLSDCLLHLNDR